MERITVAAVIAQACASHGVKRAFGVPGGGSSLDLIEAFGVCGVDFILCRTETGAALMAAADAELRNGFGVVVTTQGPGAASAMNGVAHASLDRAPVLFISDGWTPGQMVFDTHQVFDQLAMSSPVVKAGSRLQGDAPAIEIEVIVSTMLTAPWGPAHVELTGENARRVVDAWPRGKAKPAAALAQSNFGDVRDLLQSARRPVLLVGLEARDTGAPPLILEMARRLQCPVLTTYKGKGIVSDESEWLVGHFTGGAAESDCVAQADLIVLCGFDPVELIGRPWPYRAPVIDIGLVAHPVHYLKPAAAAYGAMAVSLEAVLPACRRSDWTAPEIAALRDRIADRLAYSGQGEGLSPVAVVRRAMDIAAPLFSAFTVDAGAHMFSAMAFGRARAQGDALISNGLATMGFALPAGIARALHAPLAPTIVFTGDGGLMMCAGELATAAESNANVCVIVFNDGALSLIALKQRNRGMAEAGVGWSRADFAAVATGFGLRAFTARSMPEYEDALHAAFASGGPCLIDVQVDPSGYREQAKALRG